MRKIITSLLSIIFLTIGFAGSSFASSSEETNLIPIMTSNTSPSGIASASSAWSNDHQPYSAFDRKPNDTGWSTITDSKTGWIAYEFENPVVVNKYVLTPRVSNMEYKRESPKDWTFEGWDGVSWVVLDTQKNITNWSQDEKKEFSFSNETKYKKYRLNITSNNGYVVLTLGAFEMYNALPVTPAPDPTPTPDPEQPTGDRAILVVTMDTGLEKEFDLSMKEINSFISWYEAKQAGSGTASYAIDKHNNNKGPFSNRKDYVIFNKILTFEVSEYSTK
ncbi:discoidin domain-containing protein [Paenibacillus polymyxa]|uniref:Discoidin domain-containing protein n=1 Tax=Paenibacillus polymyxa TaxID=1406 RepID=A0AAP4E9H7_PAEPO|nr:discoidin domain-containing protein [Paenibacillus polymyxa]MDH2330513.1 discoidin domain-containing protein [Paenibacillus polymyxa]